MEPRQQRMSTLSALFGCVVGLAVNASTAHALIDDRTQTCLETEAKAGAKFVDAYLRARAAYSIRQLHDGSGNLTRRDKAIARAESRLRAKITKYCGPAKLPLPTAALRLLGFPGRCPDASPTTPFDEQDLATCITVTHKNAGSGLFSSEFGSKGVDGASPLPTTPPGLRKCQRAVATSARKFVRTVFKEIQACRNRLEKGVLAGFPPAACGSQAPTEENIARARSKARARMTAACPPERLAALDVCNVSMTPGLPPLPGDPIECILVVHRNAVDNPDDPSGGNLIGIEYPEPAICGDGIVNDALAGGTATDHLGAPPEECDGFDDAACPGRCGDPDGSFPCLCTDVPRQHVVEHEPADLDIGWTGLSHDRGTAGDYVVDLYDCDGKTAMGGSEPLCTVGPSCDQPPHQRCSNDAECPGAGNFCRKRATATGPHCSDDVQKSCDNDADCVDDPGAAGFCRKTPHGPPLPLTAGTISLCVESLFSDDVTGTTNLDDGSFALALRQDFIVHVAAGTINQPCPSCGGFCDASLSPQSPGPGGRTLCASDADCPPGVRCTSDPVCSFGVNQDMPCRREPPFGHATALFGTPSVDCAPNSFVVATPDIVLDPFTSATVVKQPSVMCDAPGFGGRVCIAGADTGAACSADSECVGGGAGSCAFQCFCPTGGGLPEQPNRCFAACRGGTDDMLPCSADSDCPGGLCQQASCRLNPADTDSAAEGFCPAGPVTLSCSTTVIQGCVTDAECRRPACPFCLADNSETCVAKESQCFLNEGIVRVGSAGVPDAVGAGTFCVTPTASVVPNVTYGLPGPGALTQSLTVETTGLLD
jgi:hypothetical protein